MKKLIKNRFIIVLMLIVIMVNIICAPVYALGGSTITSLSASYSAGKVSVSGTTTEDVLAVAVMLYGTNGTTLLRMETFGVNEGSFLAEISISLSSGIYTVKAADYIGGPYATASFRHTSSSGSGGGGLGISPASAQYTADLSGSPGQGTSLPVTVDSNTGTGTTNLDEQNAQGLFSGSGTISMPSIPGVNAYKVEMPADTLSNAQGTGTLTMSTGAGNITIPENMLSSIPDTEGKKAAISIGQGDNVGLTEEEKAAVGTRPIIQLVLTLDGEPTRWNNPDAHVTVAIPYIPTAEELANPENIVIYYLDGSGELVCIPNGRYNPVTGAVTFSTTHFSLFAVGYNAVSFNDVAEDAWYNKAVAFIAVRKITSGTGGGNFSPTNKLTRSEFVVMLMRAYSIDPDENPSNNFADAGNVYYTNYLAAAKRLGISAGLGNNLFGPDRHITRQEMFTMLYNALKAINMLPKGNKGKSMSSFSDAKDISPWAIDAMKLLVETETIVGSGGKLSPKETTTRAQMAQVLYNLLSK